MRVIMFAFWGRKANVEIQLPYIHRILDQNPDVEFHGWDLSRDTTGRDSTYLRSLPESDRFRVRTEFYEGNGRAQSGQNRVWSHYAQQVYQNCTFVKLDDDDLFIETERFAAFVQAAVDNPDHVVAALTVNNGAGTRHIPELWAGFQQLLPTIPRDETPLDAETSHLLGVHQSSAYAVMCHDWFSTNWRDLCGRSTDLVPTEDWLSINCIAMSWRALRNTNRLMKRRVPRRVIAGRPQSLSLGDEGAANAQKRLIYKGLVCAHGTFGPQEKQLTAEQHGLIRKQYAELAAEYLSDNAIQIESKP